MPKILIYILFVVLFTNFVVAEKSYPVFVEPIPLQKNTLFTYTFNFSNNADCSNANLSITTNITTNQYGRGFALLNISNLTTPQKYLCEYRDGVSRANHTINSGLFYDIYLYGNIYSFSPLTFTTNVNFTSSVTINNLTVTGNTILKNVSANSINITGYYYGQPNTGFIGGGIIEINNSNVYGEINFTCSGLTCSWEKFKTRHVKTDNSEKYCDIPAGSRVVTNTQHNRLYVDYNCNIQETSIQNWRDMSVSPGGNADFGDAICYNSLCELPNGFGLENTRNLKTRNLQAFTSFNHLSYTSGMDIVFENFPNFTITAGQYVYFYDRVKTSKQNSSVSGVYVERVSHSGAATWQHIDGIGLNVTHCDTGTGTALCTSTNLYRQVLIFMVGYNDSIDLTGIHQLLPSQSTTYNTIAECLAAKQTFTKPSYYDYATRDLYAYCVRPSDTAWVSSNLIDLRSTAVVATSGGLDTSVFTRRDGTAQPSADWNFNNYGIYNLSFINVTNASYFSDGVYVNILNASNYINTTNLKVDKIVSNINYTNKNITNVGYLDFERIYHNDSFGGFCFGRNTSTGYLILSSNVTKGGCWT